MIQQLKFDTNSDNTLLSKQETELNYQFDTETKKILFNGDWYYPLDQISPRRPTITGSPKLEFEKARAFIGRNKITRKPAIGVKRAPKDCSIYHIVNYPVRKWGSPQIAFLGRYGFGKSRVLSWVEANWLTRRHQIFQFDDAEFEAQTLAYHGYFTADKLFHPYKINLWIPKGYKFNTEAHNFRPLIRNNFQVKEFTTVEDITDHLAPHVLNSIYREAFDETSLLELFFDMIKIIKTLTDENKSYVFARHEFGDMFPESPMGESYKLIRGIAMEEIRKARKNNWGIITSLHAMYDVIYYIIQKFGFVAQFRPIIHNKMTWLEQEAKAYRRGEFALSQGSGFMKHHIWEYPTPSKKSNYSAHEVKWLYPDMIPYTEKLVEDQSAKGKKLKERTEHMVLKLSEYNFTDQEMADIIGVDRSYINKIRNKKA